MKRTGGSGRMGDHFSERLSEKCEKLYYLERVFCLSSSPLRWPTLDVETLRNMQPKLKPELPRNPFLPFVPRPIRPN